MCSSHRLLEKLIQQKTNDDFLLRNQIQLPVPTMTFGISKWGVMSVVVLKVSL